MGKDNNFTDRGRFLTREEVEEKWYLKALDDLIIEEATEYYNRMREENLRTDKHLK